MHGGWGCTGGDQNAIRSSMVKIRGHGRDWRGGDGCRIDRRGHWPWDGENGKRTKGKTPERGFQLPLAC